MHQHRQGVHAHVARDVDGRNIIELVRRDDFSSNLREFIHHAQHNTNGEKVKLNIPAGFAEKDTNDSGVATAVDVVYVTMSPSFSGSVLAYVTATPDASSSTNAAIAPASITSASTSVAQAAFSTATSSSLSSASAVTLLSTTAETGSSTVIVGSPVQATYASSAAASSTALSGASAQQDVTASQQNNGMTDGAKAGLAIGIILAIALAAALFFFCWKRQKKDSSHEEYNEKSGSNEKRSSFFGGGATPAGKRTSVDSDKSFGTIHHTATAPRLSLRPVTQFLPTFGEKRKSGNMLGAAATTQPMSEKNSAWERRPQGDNPFNDSTAQANKQNPFEEGAARDVHSSASQRSWEGSEPATPSNAQFGTAAAVPVAGQAASAPRGPNNVHRVQLDFKPSMDDELELKSGQLVRMLHEYDDGWALCVRMDRSQQGVAPRTCLSKTPVKPRGPPPGGRISPQNAMRGSPQPGSRPMTPQQQSPGLARKPVPGQAI